MGNVRFISDLHFNHRNQALRRGFKNIEDHNNHIIEKWNSVVNKKDVTYILGDITMEKKEGYELLNKLNGIKHVVLGNHDKRQHVRELLNYVSSVAGAIKYKKNFILTHIPIHETEMIGRFQYNIHGHVHEHSIVTYEWDHDKKRDRQVLHKHYINVCCEAIDYIPRTLEELLNERR